MEIVFRVNTTLPDLDAYRNSERLGHFYWIRESVRLPALALLSCRGSTERGAEAEVRAQARRQRLEHGRGRRRAGAGPRAPKVHEDPRAVRERGRVQRGQRVPDRTQIGTAKVGCQWGRTCKEPPNAHRMNKNDVSACLFSLRVPSSSPSRRQLQRAAVHGAELLLDTKETPLQNETRL